MVSTSLSDESPGACWLKESVLSYGNPDGVHVAGSQPEALEVDGLARARVAAVEDRADRPGAGHHNLRHGRVSCPTVAADTNAHDLPRVALVAAQAPHRLPCSVDQAELAHVGAVHVVVEGHGADALANGGARGAVVGEREEVTLQSRRGRLRIVVGSRPTHAGRGAGAT
eukprot:scaffold19910_cov70-Phaeocystis_antarctica.AAC.7